MAKDKRPPTAPSGTVKPGEGTPGAGENVCPECGGTGRKDHQACPNCNGTGKIIEGLGGA
jgi:DnaJ-class molecular chaperone